MMTEPNFSPTAIGAGIFGAGGLLYLAWRKIVSDNKGDRLDSIYESRLQSMAKQLEELRARADKFAAERNEGVAKIAQLSERVRHLEEQLADAKERVRILEAEKAGDL